MLIGLSGYAQSGKDSVAEVLVRDFGFTRVAFADKIKELLYEMNPIIWADNQFDGYTESRFQQPVDDVGWDEAKQHDEVRRLLQTLGIGARHVFGEDFWVNQALRPGLPEKVVVTDVRFPNEMQAIWALNGKIWRVERPGIGPVNDHISEHAIKDEPVDLHINNTGTLEDLEKTVHNLMRHVG